MLLYIKLDTASFKVASLSFKVLKILEAKGITYKRKTLQVADYAWIWTENGTNIELPYIIERKRIGGCTYHNLFTKYFSFISKMYWERGCIYPIDQ